MVSLRHTPSIVKAAAVVSMWFLASAARGQEAIETAAATDVRALSADDAAHDIAAPKKTNLADIEKIIATGRDKNQAMAHLDYLTNRIGPRLTGSDGLQSACEWTREMFERFGLANAKLEQWAEWPIGFNRGPWFGRMIRPEVIELDFVTDAWSAGTKGKQRGPAILAPKNDEELAAMKDRLAGAWILTAADGGRGRGRRGATERPEGQRGGGPRMIQPNDRVEPPPAPSIDGQQPAADQANQPAASESQSRENQPADSQQTDAQPAEGQAATTAQAEVQPDEAQPQGERRGRGRRGGGGRRGGRGGGLNDPFRQRLQAAYREAGALGTITRSNNDLLTMRGRRPTTAEFWDNLPTMPQVNMTASSYDAVAKHVTAGQDVTLEFDIRNYFKKGPIPIYNVLADISGSELPDEYVIVGGHIDSWDGATGATDNGTGVATTLEAARILMASGVRPKRTIRFMLWSGEEQGILGSRAYVEANEDLMPKISGALVHDLGTQYLSSISGLSFQLADLNQVFAPVMTLNPAFPFRVRSTDSLTSLGSDHRSFVRAGVPAFFWGQSGSGFNYWDSHHSQHDTFDKAVAEYQEHSSIVIALAAYGLANLDHMLPREASGEGEEYSASIEVDSNPFSGL